MSPGRSSVSRLLRHFGALTAGIIVVVAVACSGTEEPTGPVESEPTASPTQTATAAPTPTETPQPTPVLMPTQPGPTVAQAPTPATDYDSTENMIRLFSGRDHNPDDTHEAITLAIANNDKSMVPVMIEMLRFLGDPELIKETQHGHLGDNGPGVPE